MWWAEDAQQHENSSRLSTRPVRCHTCALSFFEVDILLNGLYAAARQMMLFLLGQVIEIQGAYICFNIYKGKHHWFGFVIHSQKDDGASLCVLSQGAAASPVHHCALVLPVCDGGDDVTVDALTHVLDVHCAQTAAMCHIQ